MESLGILLAVSLLGVGLLLNTAVLLYFLVRSCFSLKRLRQSRARLQPVLLAHAPR